MKRRKKNKNFFVPNLTKLYNLFGDEVMKNNLIIKNIRTVFDGKFNPGVLNAKSEGRHSACFVCYLYGKAEYVFGDYSFTAEPGGIIYLAKGSIYEIRVFEKSKFICIDFDFEEEESGLKKSNIFGTDSEYVASEFKKIFNVWNEKNLWYVSQTFSVLYTLYTEALKAENCAYSKKNRLFSKIRSYVLSNYKKHNFSVFDAACEFGISETYLRRLFKENLCVSPIKYINDLKLEAAKGMLAVSNYTISEIAQSVGFDDPYYFSRFFKKETGISPSEYRKNFG